MPLSVTCPRCQSKYQLDEGMRGKKMRCPNTICRAVFEIRDDSEAPPPTAKPAEPPKAQEPPPPAPTPPPPHPSSPVTAKPAEPKPAEPFKRKSVPKPIAPAASEFPDFPGDDEAAPAPTGPSIATEAWQADAPEAPPTRAEPTQSVTSPVEVKENRLDTTSAAPVQRSRAWWVIAAMLLLLLVAAGVGYWQIRGSIESNEAERYARAEALYKDHQFADASAALQKLYADFPDSAHGKKYRFLAEWSDVRQAVVVRASRDETVKALERVLLFIGSYRGDALLAERDADLWQTLEFLARELTALAERDKAPELVTYSKRAWSEARKFPPPTGLGQAERKLDDEWKRVEQVLAAHFERESVIDVLRQHCERPSAAGVPAAWALVEKTKRQDDPVIRKLLDDLLLAHREKVRWTPAESDAPLAKIHDDNLPSLSVASALVQGKAKMSPGEMPVLALARGVLYALDPSNGEVRWSRRLGIDTSVLPSRVPADAITPELLLAVSSDQRSLSALIAETGAVLWQAPLSDACLGQPVLIDRQALTATRAGRIDEIEISEGRLLGSYDVGQPLSLGGVRQPGTPLIYFPADDFCLYVIDATKRSCAGVLYTRHLAGSLRSLPLVVPADKGALMLWTQVQGLDRVEIKPYELPITGPEQKPSEPTLHGNGSSAQPWYGADRLALASETGLLSLWGVRQPGMRDPILYPLFKRDFPIETLKEPGRCQIVHGDADNLWTMTQGRLQRVQSTFNAKDGPGLVARWTPTALGTLLHPIQVRHNADGKIVLFLTTQVDADSTCLASAVDAENGKILWQRQLGVLPRQEPLVLDGQIVIRDGQGLLRFAPGKGDMSWQPAGDWLLQEPWSNAEQILLGRDGRYFLFSMARGSTTLKLKVGALAGAEPTLDIKLPAPLQGTPSVGDGFLLLPLADGKVHQVSLKDGSRLTALDWRAAGAEEQARGHVVLLGKNDCVLTDGSRGIARAASADGKSWIKLSGKERTLSHRVTAAPALVPAAGAGMARWCVADASDTLTLLDADNLTVQRSWSMPGKITAGPFVRAVDDPKRGKTLHRIGCVVGRKELVWLDPDLKAPAWQYTFADIVGEPHLMDGALVVADVAGRFVALDPLTGRPLGKVLTLHANVAATASPLPFGVGRAFVPLTDGTVVLLPLQKLRAPD